MTARDNTLLGEALDELGPCGKGMAIARIRRPVRMLAVQWFKIGTKLQCEEYVATMHCSVTRGSSDGDDSDKSWNRDLLAVGGYSSQAAYGEPRQTSIASTRRINATMRDMM